MDEDLKDILTKYRSCTLQIIEVIENNNLDLLQKLIEERQKMLDEALNMTYEKEKMKQIYIELKLDELQCELNLLMSRKLSLIRAEMENIGKNKTANQIYNKGNYDSAQIFSKKI